MRVVLIGAGHAHLHVARAAHRLTGQGIEVVLVDPEAFWYSGLATGMLGGMYEPTLDRIDPKPLVERGGGIFVRARAVAIDRSRRTVALVGGDHLDYDVVSLNLGSEIAVEGLSLPDRVWTVKPIARLWALRQRLEERFRSRATTRVAVIGGGATGCEIAANVEALAARHRARAHVTLVSRGARLLESNPVGAARTLDTALAARGIERVLGRSVTAITPDAVSLDDGTSIAADEVVVATGLLAAELVRKVGLPLDSGGALRVDGTLRSIADPRVFGAGDCVSIEGYDLPKLGVFGVRAAPVLLENLLAAAGRRPLRSYRPQRKFLAILNLGHGEGLALRGRRWWHGHASLWLKDWIDRRFLRRYES